MISICSHIHIVYFGRKLYTLSDMFTSIILFVDWSPSFIFPNVRNIKNLHLLLINWSKHSMIYNNHLQNVIFAFPIDISFVVPHGDADT